MKKLLEAGDEQLGMEVMYILTIISTLLLCFLKAESCIFLPVTSPILCLCSTNTEAATLESMIDSLFSRSLASHKYITRSS